MWLTMAQWACDHRDDVLKWDILAGMCLATFAHIVIERNT